MAGRLVLVRHGQSTWNAQGRWQGQADPPLSPLGEEQAVEAAGRLAGAGVTRVTRVVTSELVRARRTGEIVAEALGLGPVGSDVDLGEYDVGEWSGLTKPEIEELWPGQQKAWFQGRLETTPGGEGRIRFNRRVLAALDRLAAGLDGDGDGDGDGVVLVVTHGGVIRTIERALGASPVPIANLSGRWFEVADDSPGSAGAPRLKPGDPVTLVGTDHRTASPSA
jgi:probable phosphoglycerate mutase